MKNTAAIGIFDIGKTNKKFFLFDEYYNILREESIQFAEREDEDGFPGEDLPALTKWVEQTIDDLITGDTVSLRAINFSAYGASFVHINKEGRPVAPLYNYLKPFPAALKEKFYNTYGGETCFSLETASPVLGNLNSGMQLYFLKYHKPKIFSSIQYSLHLPQYISYLFTKAPCSDITSIGCHTGLWNYTLQQYHRWVNEEGINAKLAPILPSDKPQRITRNGHPLLAGIGLHDSSAATIPYLLQFNEPFVLISTGTWCISLNPFNQSTLTEEQLQQDCLCYMEYKGKPVKASRLFAGYEHEQQVKRIASHFNKDEKYYKTVALDTACLKNMATKGSLLYALKKEGDYGVSIFSQRELSIFSNFEEAYHQLMADLVDRQVIATNLVLESGNIRKIFVDGGFGTNDIYMNLLATAYPTIEVYAASVAQASAMGAALAIHDEWNNKPIPYHLIQMKQYLAIK